MKKLFLAFLILFAFAACRKEPRKQYSTWIVNGTHTFKTNEYTHSSASCNPTHTDCWAELDAGTFNNDFMLSFPLDHFPDTGKFIFTNPLVSNRCVVQFYYNGQFYYHTPSKIDTVYASSVNNKVNYRMPACWFVNYDNPTGDSILVEGNFNEP